MPPHVPFERALRLERVLAAAPRAKEVALVRVSQHVRSQNVVLQKKTHYGNPKYNKPRQTETVS